MKSILALLIASGDTGEHGSEEGAEALRICEGHGGQDDGKHQPENGHQDSSGLRQQPTGEFFQLRTINFDERRKIIGRLSPGRVKLGAGNRKTFKRRGRRPDVERAVLDSVDQRRDAACRIHRRDHCWNKNYRNDQPAKQHGGAAGLPTFGQQLILQGIEADCEDDRPQQQADEGQQ